jgi:hypothetical protein
MATSVHPLAKSVRNATSSEAAQQAIASLDHFPRNDNGERSVLGPHPSGAEKIGFVFNAANKI